GSSEPEASATTLRSGADRLGAQNTSGGGGSQLPVYGLQSPLQQSKCSSHGAPSPVQRSPAHVPTSEQLPVQHSPALVHSAVAGLHSRSTQMPAVEQFPLQQFES